MEDLHINRQRHEKNDDTFVLRKVFLAFGLIFPLVGAASAGSMLKNDEYVMFLPDIAYEQADGRIAAGVQAWVYEKQRLPGFTRMLALILGIDMSSLSANKREQLYERTQLFRVDSERGKRLFILDEAGERHELPKTTANGRTSEVLSFLPHRHGDGSIRQMVFHLDGHGIPAKADEAVAYYAPPEGLSIISDIDDTIKESSVGDTKRLLVNTFLEDFVAVKGMNRWYSDMGGQSNVAFHYVSSSPIQLYPVLLQFMRETGYPQGSMHLREATRWTDVIPRAKGSRQHKMRAIERLLLAYPQRKFILIGDSSEEDPAIYAHFMRRYPHQVLYICIRDVTPGLDAEIYDQIFDGIDRRRWLVTDSVEKMRDFVRIDFNLDKSR